MVELWRLAPSLVVLVVKVVVKVVVVVKAVVVVVAFPVVAGGKKQSSGGVAKKVVVVVCRVALSRCWRVPGMCGRVHVPPPPPIGTWRCGALLPVVGSLIVVGG